MSTLAIYGDAGDTVLDETAPSADGPPQMAGVARAWETAAIGATARRQIVLRTAVVLDPGTPAYERLTWLTRWAWAAGSAAASSGSAGCTSRTSSRSSVLHRRPGAGRRGSTRPSPEPVRNTEFMAAFRPRLGPACRPAYAAVGAQARRGAAAHRSGAGPDRSPLRAGQAGRPRLRLLLSGLGPALDDLRTRTLSGRAARAPGPPGLRSRHRAFLATASRMPRLARASARSLPGSPACP